MFATNATPLVHHLLIIKLEPLDLVSMLSPVYQVIPLLSPPVTRE